MAERSKRVVGYARARKLIRAGKASGLVVWKIDRCSRSVRDWAEIVAELRHHDADFVSVTESFDTSNAMGRAMLQITMVFAELERARMGERAAAWQAYRAKQGGTPTTRAILGYRRVDGQLRSGWALGRSAFSGRSSGGETVAGARRRRKAAAGDVSCTKRSGTRLPGI